MDMQVHVASGHYLSEIDAHCGRRIWSVAHSRLRPHLAATASDDCTAKLWAGSAFDSPVATITLPGSPAVCCADFSQHDANVLALAAADARVYLYDLRQLAQPMAVLRGHSRPVSYAKFFGAPQLVSASVDGTLAAWDLVPALGQPVSSSSGTGNSSSSSASVWPATGSSWQVQQQQPQQQQLSQPWKVFKGHTNEKNFVGLAVQPSAGLMAVGSETGEVFAYHTSWSDPLARHRLDAAPAEQQCVQQLTQPTAVAWSRQLQQRSACAVAWQPTAPGFGSSSRGGAVGGSFGPSALLAAANSAGECKLLALVDA
jgi:E3 ubiquitin-protein ligase RFWD2